MRLQLSDRGLFTRRRKGKGQALVELALMGLLLGMLLAAAVDMGRAYYTAVVVTNMAGEGAAYGALNPEKDANYPQPSHPPADTDCSEFPILHTYDYIQERARQVAINRGLIIHQPQQADISVTPACVDRCVGNAIRVTVTYTITDLFLPGMIGINNITIRRTATQLITKNAHGADCED
jgi:hypothetical protein